MYTKYIVTRHVGNGIRSTTTYSSGEWLLLTIIKLMILVPIFVVVFSIECFIFLCSLFFEILLLPFKIVWMLIRR